MATALEPTSFAVPEVRQTQLLIGGKWQDAVSGKTFATVNPATEETIKTLLTEINFPAA